jgi:BirA family biotin operon repressor/biotin-[acetyl-CoA-carboxylase] ligase
MQNQPVKGGLIVIQADRQTIGHGRRGTPFYSDHPGGLWVSIISPIPDVSLHFNHNRALSLAIADALGAIDKDASIAIKWPNDIYWRNKKICGILLENHPTFPNLLITGFGLNVNMPLSDFPSELHSIVTSVLNETNQSRSLSTLLHSIIGNYYNNINSDQKCNHSRYLQYIYKKNCLIEIDGKQGIFDSVEEDGRLRLICEDTTIFITTGSIRFLDGTK